MKPDYNWHVVRQQQALSPPLFIKPTSRRQWISPRHPTFSLSAPSGKDSYDHLIVAGKWTAWLMSSIGFEPVMIRKRIQPRSTNFATDQWRTPAVAPNNLRILWRITYICIMFDFLTPDSKMTPSLWCSVCSIKYLLNNKNYATDKQSSCLRLKGGSKS